MPAEDAQLIAKLSACRQCPRLVAHRSTVRTAYPTYQANPIGAWGPRTARLLIVGLAPGLHGAARTGKAFVGDASGDFLFEALHRHGFASNADPAQATLLNTRITNAVKCLPPGNAPTNPELRNCAPYLEAELAMHAPPRARQTRVVLALGVVAHRAVFRALNARVEPFAHNAEFALRPRLQIVSSFHPSRLNVNTKRITQTMLDDTLSGVQQTLAV